MQSFGREKTEQALADFEAAPIDDKLRATLRFLRKFTHAPDELGPADAQAVLAAGVTRAALHEAMYVAFLFNVYDRLADTLGWDVPPQAAFDTSAKFLLKFGYK